MKLHYSNQDGASREFELGEQAITIGRSADADIILLDEKVSRHHCGIRGADGALFIKDLKSKNGTFVNGERIESARLLPSDVIKVGSYTFTFEQPAGAGAQTALREISDEMSAGKGYATLLKEIVKDSGVPAEPLVSSEKPAGTPAMPPVNIPADLAAPPKISLPAAPKVDVSTTGTASAAPKAPAAPEIKKPLGPTRPKILLKSPVRPAVSGAPASAPAPKVEAPKAVVETPEAAKPEAESKASSPDAAPATTGKTVIRKPVRPPIRLNLNKKL